MTKPLRTKEGAFVMFSLFGIPWGFEGFQEILNFHPVFVHFPIALLSAACGFYFLGIVFRKEELLAVGKWSLYFGALSALLAVVTGLQAADTVSHNDETHQIMMAHQYLGFVILGLSAFLSAWLLKAKANLPQKRKPIFLLALLLLAIMIAQQGDFGGRLVFLHGVGVGKKSMSQHSSHEHHDHSTHQH
ncbi:MAG: DUF2231 domain-containing protein [Candidatus Omnitrophica bacterium]|nr:DUF2231 domain-containing protein [Candidatus Omnitrophota bacterium]